MPFGEKWNPPAPDGFIRSDYVLVYEGKEIKGSKLLRKFGFPYRPVIHLLPKQPRVNPGTILYKILNVLSDELMTYEEIIARDDARKTKSTY